MTEDDLLSSVLDLCKLLHLRTAHFRPARTTTGWRTAVSGDGKGFPDLVIVGPQGLKIRELKTDRGRVVAEQAEWIRAFHVAGIDVDTWRPRHWRDGQIERELKALAGRAVTP